MAQDVSNLYFPTFLKCLVKSAVHVKVLFELVMEVYELFVFCKSVVKIFNFSSILFNCKFSIFCNPFLDIFYQHRNHIIDFFILGIIFIIIREVSNSSQRFLYNELTVVLFVLFFLISSYSSFLFSFGYCRK